MNIGAKILNKILANTIQHQVKKIMHHDLFCFIPRTQGWFSIYKSINVIQNINRSKDTLHMILSIDAEKAFDKIQYPIIIIALKKLEMQGMFLIIIKATYDKPRVNILSGEQLKQFLLKSGMTFSTPFIVLGLLARAIRQ
jgi:hypothetical protein